MLIFVFGCKPSTERQYLEAKNGVIDLSKWNFESAGTIPLNGAWEFYWKKYLKGGDFLQYTPSALVQVPDSWDKYQLREGENPKIEGYATYRLLVKVPQNYVGNELLAVRIGYITTNYGLFIQGQPMNTPRKLGTIAEDSDGHYDPEIYHFMPQKDTIEIVLHVANFNYKLGGITQHIILGKSQQISNSHERNLLISFFSMGILVIMGCAHLILYFFRSQTYSILYFTIYCFLIALRVLVTDEYYITDLLPNADFEVGNKISYLTFFAAVPALAAFLWSLYPEDFSLKVLRPLVVVSALFSLVVIFFKGIFYSNYIIYYQIITLIIIVYSLYFLVRILIKQRQGSIIIAVGMFTITCTAINDILHANMIIETIDLMPIGSFIFIFSQTLILSKSLASTFKQVESMSNTLKINNQELESTVKQRTLTLRDTNEELSQNLEELRANIELVDTQNKEIKTKNHNIKVSINYARTIQHNILPSFSTIQSHFSDSFLIFKPKDIVSGDFYYFKQKRDKLILVAVDCMGHGVPGAFMSIIGHEILTQIIDYQKIIEPSHILQSLHLEVKKFLRQDILTNRNGMDIGLVVIDKTKGIISFAGAKSPLVYVKNGEMELIEGSNTHIGGNNLKDSEFEQTTIPFSANDSLSFYLFSDGYQDQFGEESNKKLMKKHFRELLFQVHTLPMQAQEDLLTEWHEAWKGKSSQTDDILVIGVRVV